MRVDVDFLNPIVDSVKKTSRDIWRQLPPEARRTLPYVAVAFTSGLIVYKFQHRKYALEVNLVAAQCYLLSGSSSCGSFDKINSLSKWAGLCMQAICNKWLPVLCQAIFEQLTLGVLLKRPPNVSACPTVWTP